MPRNVHKWLNTFRMANNKFWGLDLLKIQMCRIEWIIFWKCEFKLYRYRYYTNFRFPSFSSILLQNQEWDERVLREAKETKRDPFIPALKTFFGQIFLSCSLQRRHQSWSELRRSRVMYALFYNSSAGFLAGCRQTELRIAEFFTLS